MYSQYPTSASDDNVTFFLCGNCGVKLESNALEGDNQLSLKAALYPQASSSSVSVCEALSEIFKVKVPHEIRDATLCYDCTTILQQLYTIWQSFVDKSNPSSVLCRVLTDEYDDVDGPDVDSNSTRLLLQKKRPTKARLKARIARRETQQEEDGLRRSKRKRSNGGFPAVTCDNFKIDVDTSFGIDHPRNVTSYRDSVSVDVEPGFVVRTQFEAVSSSTTSSNVEQIPDLGLVDFQTRKRKRGRPRKANPENRFQKPKYTMIEGSQQNEQNKERIESNTFAVGERQFHNVEVVDDVEDDHLSCTFENASVDDVDEKMEDQLLVTVNLAPLQTPGYNLLAPEPETKPNTASTLTTSSILKRGRGRPRKDGQLRNIPPYDLGNIQDGNVLSTPNSVNINDGDEPHITRHSLRKNEKQKEASENPHDGVIEDEEEEQQNSCSDSESSDSHSEDDEGDIDFDPEGAEDRERYLESLPSQKRLIRKDQAEAAKELARTGKISKQFPCDECGRRFLKKEGLQMHTSQIHRRDKGSLICTFENCGKRLSDRGALESHMNQHLGLKPYICDQCAWTTTAKYLLRNHLRTHLKPEEKEELKTKICDVCGARFFKTSYLTSHMKVHVEDKPYVCSFEGCNVKFKTTEKLKRHEVEIHLDPSPKFSCDRCGREFNRKWNLVEHIRVHEKYDLNGGKMRKSRDAPVRKSL